MCLLSSHFLPLSEPATSWQCWQLTGFYLFRHLQRKNKINNGVEEGKEDSDIDSQREGSWNTGQGDGWFWSCLGNVSLWKENPNSVMSSSSVSEARPRDALVSQPDEVDLGVEADQQKKGEKDQLYLGGALSIFATYFIVCLFGFLSTCGYRLTVSSPRSNMAWDLCRYPSCCCINCIMVST